MLPTQRKGAVVKYRRRLFFLTCATALASLLISACATSIPQPPPTPTDGTVDTLFGVVVPDPYRWMETDTTEKITEWIDAQNAYTQHLLDRYPARDRVAERIDKLMQIGAVDVPRIKNGVAFYEKRVGTEDQPNLLIRRPGQEPEVLIDVAALSEDASTAMDWFYPSTDASLLAYGLSEGGSEQSTLYVMNVTSKENTGDVIPHCRAGSVAWLSDNSGFFYTRYPAPGTVPEGDENYYRRVYFHEIGSDPADDTLIFGADREKTEWPALDISDDDKWLVIYNFTSFTQTELFALNRETNRWQTIVEGIEANFLADFNGHDLYLMTNYGAPPFPHPVDEPGYRRAGGVRGDHPRRSRGRHAR